MQPPAATVKLKSDGEPVLQLGEYQCSKVSFAQSAQPIATMSSNVAMKNVP
jgi:hypothetical protein